MGQETEVAALETHIKSSVSSKLKNHSGRTDLFLPEM